jgi:hypothetical protein
MGSIYSAASLVIIAAAGSDPSYGLPGVSIRPRHPQRLVKMGDCTLVETHYNVKWAIENSQWAKRAWTYQEGHLARRRLIFTDYQVAYVCDNAICLETLGSTIRCNEARTHLSMDNLFATNVSSWGSFLRPCMRRRVHD